MNSAPSSFVISKILPCALPAVWAAHHDIKLSPMTTLARPILHTALQGARDLMLRCSCVEIV
jgi:hypothetical protein